jgi:hypothetical protein
MGGLEPAKNRQAKPTKTQGGAKNKSVLVQVKRLGFVTMMVEIQRKGWDAQY